jgi:hypothetical protein
MKFKIGILLSILLTLAGCSPADNQPIPKTSDDLLSDQEAIYDEAITETLGPQPVYVIEQSAGCLIEGEDPHGFDQNFSGLRDDTLANYIEKIDQTESLQGSFTGMDDYVMIDEREYWLEGTPVVLPHCPGPGSLSLELLQADYPGAAGVIHLSPIGYSSDDDQALVCIGMNTGGCYQRVDIILLDKEADRWKVQDSFRIEYIP